MPIIHSVDNLPQDNTVTCYPKRNINLREHINPMKTTQKIVIINTAVAISFLLGITSVSAEACIYPQTTNSTCNGANHCTYPGPVSTGVTGVCVDRNMNYRTQNGNQNNAGFNPATPVLAPITTPICPQGYVLTGSACTLIPDPCPGTIPPRVSLQENTASVARANVFEALWNFLTHKGK